jgi:hypothetical protein
MQKSFGGDDRPVGVALRSFGQPLLTCGSIRPYVRMIRIHRRRRLLQVKGSYQISLRGLSLWLPSTV